MHRTIEITVPTSYTDELIHQLEQVINLSVVRGASIEPEGVEGEVSVQVGEEVRVNRPGDLVFKPRGVPHAVWNSGDVPARVLEIIFPQGSSGTSWRLQLFSLLPRVARCTSNHSLPLWIVWARDGYEHSPYARRAPRAHLWVKRRSVT
jgi:hypothetical protein